MTEPLGLIRERHSFWRRPHYDLDCWTHGRLGRFGTAAEASSRWQFHVQVVPHTHLENRSRDE